jgi:hypothetical protein
MLLLPLTASPDRDSLVVLAGVFSLLIRQSLYTLSGQPPDCRPG